MGSRLGRGVSLGIVSAVVAGMLVGCKPAPVEPPPETPEQKAAKLISKADADIAKAATADDVAAVEATLPKILELDAKADVAALKKKIADKKAELEAAKLKKQLDALVADGKALLADDPNGAKAKAQEALKLDAESAAAKKLLADAQAAINTRDKDEIEAEYVKVNGRIDAAIRAGRNAEAIKLIKELEALAAKGGGRSRRSEIAKLEAKDLVAEARTLARSNREADLNKAMKLLGDAERKDRTNREISGLKRMVAAKLQKTKVDPRIARHNAAMQAAKRLEASDNTRDLSQALRKYREAEGVAPDARSRRAAQDGAKRVRDRLSYFDNVAKARQEKARGNLDRALRFAQTARRVRSTAEVRDLIKQIEGAMAISAADKAEKAGDLAGLVSNLEKAERLGMDVKERLAKAVKRQKEGALAGQIAAIKAAVAADNYTSVAPKIDDLLTQYPDNAELLAIKKAGPSKKELAARNKAAVAAYKKIMADASKVDPKRHQEKIEVYKNGLPQVAGSRYVATLESMIKREKDAIYRGQYQKVSQTANAMRKDEQLDQKISYLTGERARFEGTSYLKQIDGMISAAKTQKATKAFQALNGKVAKMAKNLNLKISTLESASGEAVYKDTRYVKQIEGMITAAKNARAAGEHRKLTTELAKYRKPGQEDQKITILQTALAKPVYEGTRYVDMIKASIKREKDSKARKPLADLNARVAKAPTPQAKLAILEGEVNNAIFAGTSLKDQIVRNIDTQKNAIKAAEFNKLRKDTSKPKMSDDEKIAIISRAQSNFAGTRYERSVKGMLDAAKNAKMSKAFNALRTRVTKDIKLPHPRIAELQREAAKFAGTRYEKQIASMIQREKDAIAAKKYGDLMKRISQKNIKPEEVITQLEAAKQDSEIIGSRYEKIVAGRLTKEKTALKSKLYTAMLTEMNNPKAKRDSAAKAQFLKERKGDFVGTTFEKSIDAMIKKYESLIEREKKAKAAAEKKAAAAKAAAEARAKAAAEKKRKADAARKAAAEQKKADADAAKVYGAVIKGLKPAKTVADCDANISKLQEAKLKVAKSARYVKLIDAQIKKEGAIKAKLEKAAKPK